MRERYTETSFSRRPSICFPRLYALAMLATVALLCASGASAQDEDGDEPRLQAEQPPRMLGLFSAGVPLRLTLNDKLDQSRVAPSYGSVLLGYTLSGEKLRHGFGLGVSFNMGHEGGYTTPVYAGDQVTLMPSYLAHYSVNRDVFGVGHVGLPFLVRGGRSLGFEVGAALAYRVFAGSGVFAALNLDAFGADSFNLLASFELGVVIDYEVLP